MADIQSQFVQFHEAIKLNNFEENVVLREKRDLILDKLRTNLGKDFDDKGQKPPTFTTRNQGSYAMGTGVKPLYGDYDIDVAVIFNIDKSAYPDPTKVKQWVVDALRGHNVEMKRPCVTVQYQRKGEPIYHLDLPIYSAGDQNADGKTYLAKGFPGSASENKRWEPSDFVALCEKINNRFEGSDREQFRRVIRCLKRWKDHRFPSSGNAAPVGIGVTIAAYNWFEPKVQSLFSGKPDDLGALLHLVRRVLEQFQTTWTGEGFVSRLKLSMPVEPWDNPFDRMSDKQMSNLESRLKELRDGLADAQRRVDPVEAAKLMREHFGDDFPVPEPKDTGSRGGSSIVSSGRSA